MKKELLDLAEHIKTIMETGDVPYGIANALTTLNQELDLCLAIPEKKDVFFDCENIQIGGGKRYLPNYINLDIKEPADVLCDVRKAYV